jgi:formylglycine-generating enzyme required for sulfatase activity
MSSPGLQLLASQLDAARAQTDALFSLLDPAALYDRPVADRHRLIFYLGHVEAFDWNLLSGRAFQKPSFHPDFDKLFAFGIDPEPGRAPSDQPADWPSEKEVRGYCLRVRRELDEALAKSGEHDQDQLLNVAVEHRMMHAETLAYLFHNLPYESKHVGPAVVVEQRTASRLARPPGFSGRLVLNNANDNSLVENPMIEIPAGVATLGQPTGDGFGWDNEFERHSVSVPAFRISRFKITNGEYLAYLRATGAEQSNGTGTARERQQPPHFWIKRDGRWFLRAMFGEIPLPLDWPVYVTHREASAYIQWRSGMEYENFALPSEAQFHRAAEGASPINANFERWDPVAVDVGTNGGGGESRHGVAQTIGNGWEWTSTVFAPFPGFEPFPFYPGYSADFFDGQHFVMKGGSPRTARALLRPSFRNWFRADYPYVYAGFRMAENAVKHGEVAVKHGESVVEDAEVGV